MPAIYAHKTFGNMVFEKLSDEDKNIIKKYPHEYEIGQMGPDFLFFYRCYYVNNVVKKGTYLHRHDIYSFMNRSIKILRESGNDAQKSYMLGFICHLSLDYVCHPYIEKSMKTTGCGHTEIEGDFERFLIQKRGYRAADFPVDVFVPATKRMAKTMSGFYADEGLSGSVIYTALRWAKTVKRLLICPGIIKYSLFDILFRMTFHYKNFKGLVISDKPVKKCHKTTRILYRLYLGCTDYAADLIRKYDETLKNNRNLPDDFHIDFYGKTYEEGTADMSA